MKNLNKFLRLSKALLSCILLVSFASPAFSQILTYTSDTTGVLSSVATNATGTNLTRINGATRPTAICASGFSSTSFTSVTTYSSTLPGIEASATPNTGYMLNVTGFSVDIRRSTTGPNNVRFAYSIDGGATWTDQGIDQNPNNATCGTTITATWTTSFTVPASTTLLFAVFGFNATGTTGTFQVLNLYINGTVTSSGATCATPAGLTATGITSTSAVVSWSAVTGASSYKVQYRPTGTTPWSTTTTASTSVTLSGLTPATPYDYEVETICSATDSSGYSSISNFTTLSGTTATCAIPTGLTATGITSTSAVVSWSAVTGASSYKVQYRPTGTTPWSTTTTASTSVTLSGLTPATPYDYEVETICSATDSSGYSGIVNFTTASPGTGTASSGKMEIYFTTPVDTSVSTGVKAIYLNNSFADTIIAYINRAKYSIDIAQYDYIQTSYFSNIANAVNNAYLAGKKVRWIYDGSASNTGITLLNPGIHTFASPTGGAYNIMHNKFIIIDANSTNPDDAIVNTGSEDWSGYMFQGDFNNMIFIQDSAIAHLYLDEFNMMWGDTSVAPNTTLSKFGPYKTDLGRHIFNVGGKEIEVYFSPSDTTDNHIQSSINSANTDLYFGVYEFTKTVDANDIVARQTAGVYVRGIVDQYTSSSAAYPILTSGLGSNLVTYSSSTLLYHNKMMIVDPSNKCSDPQVLTGSHNWTTAANSQNDENTLIIHNDTVANIYYQSFYANFTSLGGSISPVTTGCVLSAPELSVTEDLLQVYPNPTDGNFNVRLALRGKANVSMDIYNMMGQHIMNVVNNPAYGAGSYNFDVAIANPGVYYIRLVVNGNIYTQKLVKL